MILPGRLSASTLGDLLGALHRESITGLLELSEIRGPRGASVPGRVHRVHLRNGLVAAIDTALPVPPIGEILRREGLATADVISRLLGRLDSGDRRPSGEILERDGLAPAEAVRAALRRQLRERIDALFGLEEASVAFRTARPLPALRILPLAPIEFLHGRARARDRRASTGRAQPPRTSSPRNDADSAPRSGTRRIDEARDHACRLLGIPSDAGTSEARRAFRRLASALHPDCNTTAPPAEQRLRAARFAELSAAYHLLVA